MQQLLLEALQFALLYRHLTKTPWLSALHEKDHPVVWGRISSFLPRELWLHCSLCHIGASTPRGKEAFQATGDSPAGDRLFLE